MQYPKKGEHKFEGEREWIYKKVWKESKWGIVIKNLKIKI